MSDFDREAERERLREKYERDQEKREATEQMSELLLQGATMTNQHCPECHSPVFRYEGTEFCPTCQQEITEGGETAGEEGAEPPAEDRTAADAAANGEVADSVDAEPASGTPDPNGNPQDPTATPSSNAAQPGTDAAQPGTDAAQPGTDADRQSEPRTADRREAESRSGRPAETRPATTGERRPARVDPPTRREEPRDAREATTEGGDLGEAEAALIREITDLTRRAEETRDVGRKRDLFAAAREATETLRELRRL